MDHKAIRTKLNATRYNTSLETVSAKHVSRNPEFQTSRYPCIFIAHDYNGCLVILAATTITLTRGN